MFAAKNINRKNLLIKKKPSNEKTTMTMGIAIKGILFLTIQNLENCKV